MPTNAMSLTGAELLMAGERIKHYVRMSDITNSAGNVLFVEWFLRFLQVEPRFLMQRVLLLNLLSPHSQPGKGSCAFAPRSSLSKRAKCVALWRGTSTSLTLRSRLITRQRGKLSRHEQTILNCSEASPESLFLVSLSYPFLNEIQEAL